MKLHTTLTRNLGIEHPILLAPMDLVADARLAMAVIEAGGYAFLGAGYGDEEWLKRELPLLNARAGDAGRAAFGVGFITWSLARKPHLLDLVLEQRPDAVWLSYGEVAPFARRIKAAGAKLVCQVQSEAAAAAALEAGADILVAQGAEAGGHGVSRGTLTLVPAVVDLAGPRIPVVAAGGIADGRGLAANLMLGACGVAMGTRFYATLEAAAHEAAKQRIVDASGDDSQRSIVFDISRSNVWPAPYTGRCLINEHLRRWAGRELELVRSMSSEGRRYAEARANGDFDTAAVIAGEAAALIHEVPSTGELIQRIVDEAVTLLRRAPMSVVESDPRGATGRSSAAAQAT
jgi:nitronate monooxygenase